MKIVFAISRLFLILCIWTVGYFFWFQQLTIALWSFNPLAKSHWEFIWREWQNGWVIQSFREWLFVIALFAMLPIWFTGWAILCTVPWTKWFKIILLFPIKLIKAKYIEKKKEKHTKKPKVTKKKSYKQTRPPAVRSGSGRIKQPEKEAEPEKQKVHEESKKSKPVHSESHPKPKHETTPPKAASTPVVSRAKSDESSVSGGSIMDILRNAGYRLISDTKISGKKVDFIGVAANHLLLCLVDSESGDWLADEERFNDEEPLWFSESNHRISPVRLILNAREALMPQLSGAARGLEVKPMVVIRQGTIINAEDMFEVWNGLNVEVCRFADGGPEEISPLSNAIGHVNAPDEALYHDVSGLLS